MTQPGKWPLFNPSSVSGQFREVHLLPYHKTGSHKYRRLEKEYDFGDLETPGDEWMQLLREQIESAGPQVTIGG